MIENGQNIDESDFVATSAGAVDAGKVAKLNASGKLDKTFPSIFGCKVHQNVAESYTGGARTFQVEDFDHDSMYDGTHPSRITIHTAGVYLIGGCVAGGSPTTNVGVEVRLNGSTTIAAGGGNFAGSPGNGGGSITSVALLSADDYVELVTNSNSSQNTSGDAATNFWAILLQSS